MSEEPVVISGPDPLLVEFELPRLTDEEDELYDAFIDTWAKSNFPQIPDDAEAIALNPIIHHWDEDGYPIFGYQITWHSETQTSPDPFIDLESIEFICRHSELQRVLLAKALKNDQ